MIWKRFPHYRSLMMRIHPARLESSHNDIWSLVVFFVVSLNKLLTVELLVIWGAMALMNNWDHHDDVRMDAIASQITSLAIVYSAFYSGVDQRKHQSSASLAFVWGIHRDRWIPHTKASYAENVSIWWRHHVCFGCLRNRNVHQTPVIPFTNMD